MSSGVAVAANELLDLLGRILASAKKAEGDDPAEKERCIDGLKSLLKFKVTTSLLSETQAGKRVRTLSKHPASEIATIASKVVSEWKEVVKKESMQSASQDTTIGLTSKANTPAVAPTSVSDAPPSQQQSTQVASPALNNGTAVVEITTQQDKVTDSTTTNNTATTNNNNNNNNTNDNDIATKTTSDTQQQQTTTQEFDIPSTGDTVRDKVRKNLAVALQIAIDEGAQSGDPVDVAVQIENQMYSDLEGVSAKYKTKVRQLQFNLKDPKNPDLRRKVLEGDIQPDVLLILQPEELASNAKREENQKIREKKLFDAAPSAVKHATTDQFRCGKCGKRECTYYQMQTRSADEPATTYVTCTNCLNRWKFC